ncbi:MAG TPA: hypothetical protein VF959_05010, partial [Casimicrobiaceae bacterium]
MSTSGKLAGGGATGADGFAAVIGADDGAVTAAVLATLEALVGSLLTGCGAAGASALVDAGAAAVIGLGSGVPMISGAGDGAFAG